VGIAYCGAGQWWNHGGVNLAEIRLTFPRSARRIFSHHEFDKMRLEAALLRFAGRIKRINGNAMASESGSGIEGVFEELTISATWVECTGTTLSSACA
jgi:hypothetical protein